MDAGRTRTQLKCKPLRMTYISAHIHMRMRMLNKLIVGDFVLIENLYLCCTQSLNELVRNIIKEDRMEELFLIG